MTLSGVVDIDEFGRVGCIAQMRPYFDDNGYLCPGTYYPANHLQARRMERIERRAAAGTFVCEHCGEPLTADHKADARFCGNKCRVAAHYAKWNKWNETVIKTTEGNLANMTRQYGPDHHKTHDAHKHLEWALSNRGRRKNRKPGRRAHF